MAYMKIHVIFIWTEKNNGAGFGSPLYPPFPLLLLGVLSLLNLGHQVMPQTHSESTFRHKTTVY